MQGPVACESHWEGAVSGLCPDDGAGVAVAYVHAGGGGLRLVGEVRWWPSRLAIRSTSPSISMVSRTAWSWGVACPPRSAGVGAAFMSLMTMGGGEHGHLAVCLGQGLEEGFRHVAEGDVTVDEVELPSVPDDFVDAQPPWDAQVVGEVKVDARLGIHGGPLVPVALLAWPFPAQSVTTN